MDSWLSAVSSVLKVALLAFAGFSLLVFVVQRWVAFPGSFRSPPRPEATGPEGAEQIWLDTSFGRVEGWFFPAPGDAPAPAIVYAHGNGELIDDWATEMSDLAERGVHVLAVEFPGYGFSEGKPTRETIRETFSEAFDRLAGRSDVDGDRIVAYGRSMGGGAAADLALDRPVAGLVLQSTFSSTVAMARTMLVPGFLVRDRFDVVDAVERYEGPVLLMHGPDDDVIPFRHAQRIAAARDDLDITVIDCAHNDCAPVWPDIRDHVVGFLDAHDLRP